MSPTRALQRSDERGSVLPLVALITVALMIASALTVDLGMLAATNRKLQGVADLAAIAASGPLTGDACNRQRTSTRPKTLIEEVKAAAEMNAAKNGFPGVAPKTLVVEVGVLHYESNGAPRFQVTHSSITGPDCMISSVPAAVRVTVGDYTKYAFGPLIGMAGRYTERSAVAGRNRATVNVLDPTRTQATGAFMIGSSVATLDSTNSPILTSVLNGMVCRGVGGCSFSTNLVGYQGLASANVTLGQLAQARAGMVTVRELLNADLTAADLYLASAKALGCTSTVGCSNTAAVTLLGLAGTVTSTAKFKLSSLISVATGSESAAAASSFNVFGLVQGSAQVINGTNAVSIPATSFSLPAGLGTTTVSIKVIEGPKAYIGPAGVPCIVVPAGTGSTAPPTVSGSCALTSQVEVSVNQDLNLLGIPILGTVGATAITGTLPITTSAGKATGRLTKVNCAPKGEAVSVDTTGAQVVIGKADGTKFLDVAAAGIRVAGLNVNGAATAGGVTGSPLNFNFPKDYLPARATPKTVNGTSLNVQGTTISSSVDTAGITVNAAALTTALTGPSGVVTLLDSAVATPIFKALGASVANADVWAFNSPNCGPALTK